MTTNAQLLGNYLLNAHESVSCAESCTAGMVAAAITDIPGSSAWFEMGFITYSNQAKTQLLGVSTELLNQHGAVSEQVVRAMASGAKKQADADWSIAVSGIAGPDGGSATKPVGTVWFAFATPQKNIFTKHYLLQGDRFSIRQQATEIAIKELLDACKKQIITT